MNDKHVQTERSEWGLSPVPAGLVEPAPECQSKRPLHPKLFDKDWTAGPFFSLACLHDPDLQCGYGGKKPKHRETERDNDMHGRETKKETSVESLL